MMISSSASIVSTSTTTTNAKLMTVCIICDEKQNKSKHKPVKCLYCNFEACRECCKTYLLTVSDAKCMGSECGKPWTRKFMMENLTKSFMTNEYKKHRERVFFERQQAKLPETQLILEDYKALETKRARIGEINKLLRELKDEKWQIEREIYPIQQRVDALLQGLPPPAPPVRRVEEAAEAAEEPPTTRQQVFVYKCTQEDCRGFLSTQWKCGLCEKYTCKDCRCPIDCTSKTDQAFEDHVCDANDVETVKLLRDDTKPCPKCASLIYKTDGCDQMWCTQCHVAFSWTTGKLEEKLHNPHYFEWLRRQSPDGEIPRQPGDQGGGGGCNNLNTIQLIVPSTPPRDRNNDLISITYIDTSGKPNKRPTCHHIMNYIIQKTTHIANVELPRYILNEQKCEKMNALERIKYMRNEITLERFGKALQIIHKKIEKTNDLANVLTLFRDSMTDIIFRHNTPTFDYEGLVQEIHVLVTYVNECFLDIHKTFGCIQYQIHLPATPVFNTKYRYRNDSQKPVYLEFMTPTRIVAAEEDQEEDS